MDDKDMVKTEYKPLFAVSVGNINIRNKCCRKALEIIKGIDGVYGIYPCVPHGTLIFFLTLNNAKVGRNICKNNGIKCGVNISKFRIGTDGVPEYIGGAE